MGLGLRRLSTRDGVELVSVGMEEGEEGEGRGDVGVMVLFFLVFFFFW